MCLVITTHILVGQLGSQGKKEVESTFVLSLIRIHSFPFRGHNKMNKISRKSNK
jgi:hypothetical protein